MNTEQYLGCSVFLFAGDLPVPESRFSFGRRTLNHQDAARFNGRDESFASSVTHRQIFDLRRVSHTGDRQTRGETKFHTLCRNRNTSFRTTFPSSFALARLSRMASIDFR